MSDNLDVEADCRYNLEALSGFDFRNYSLNFMLYLHMEHVTSYLESLLAVKVSKQGRQNMWLHASNFGSVRY